MTVRPGADPAAAAAIRRAMAKQPSERFPTAAAFIDALTGRRLTAAVQRTSRPIAVPPKKKSRAGLVLALLAMVAVGTAFAVPATRPRATELWTMVRDRGLATGQDLAARAGIVIPPMPGDEPLAAADSGVPTLDIDSLERVIAALPSGPDSSVSAFAADDSTRLPLLDTLARAPLSTESPETRRTYQRVTGPDPGFVKVTYAGGIAQVRVDGRTYGFTPQVIRVEPGQRFISLIGNSYTPSQFVLEVPPGDTVTAAFRVLGAARSDTVSSAASPAAANPVTSTGPPPVGPMPAGAPPVTPPPPTIPASPPPTR